MIEEGEEEEGEEAEEEEEEHDKQPSSFSACSSPASVITAADQGRAIEVARERKQRADQADRQHRAEEKRDADTGAIVAEARLLLALCYRSLGQFGHAVETLQAITADQRPPSPCTISDIMALTGLYQFQDVKGDETAAAAEETLTAAFFCMADEGRVPALQRLHTELQARSHNQLRNDCGALGLPTNCLKDLLVAQLFHFHKLRGAADWMSDGNTWQVIGWPGGGGGAEMLHACAGGGSMHARVDGGSMHARLLMLVVFVVLVVLVCGRRAFRSDNRPSPSSACLSVCRC